MRRLIFGVVMFSVGLATGPRATVAGRDETLALLCQRFELTAAHGVRYAQRMADELRRNGDFAEQAAKLAIVSALGDVRDMVCISGPRRPR